jgi:hypothetical protein
VAFCHAKKINRRCGKCAQKERANRPEERVARSLRQSKCVGEKNQFFGKKHSESTKVELSILAKKQIASGVFRRDNCNNYSTWLEKYGQEEADRRYQIWIGKLSKLSSGKNNPMYGKPSPQGSGNGWSGWYKGWYFRSLRELSCAISLDAANRQWISAEESSISIYYKDCQGKERTYYADFLVDGCELIEVKPERLHRTPLVLAKQDAAIKYCEARGWKYVLIDPQPLTHAVVRELHQSGTIRFTEKYEVKFREHYLD